MLHEAICRAVAGCFIYRVNKVRTCYFPGIRRKIKVQDKATIAIILEEFPILGRGTQVAHQGLSEILQKYLGLFLISRSEHTQEMRIEQLRASNSDNAQETITTICHYTTTIKLF